MLRGGLRFGGLWRSPWCSDVVELLEVVFDCGGARLLAVDTVAEPVDRRGSFRLDWEDRGREVGGCGSSLSSSSSSGGGWFVRWLMCE